MLFEAPRLDNVIVNQQLFGMERRSMGFAGGLFIFLFLCKDAGATPTLLYSEATRELAATVSSEYNHTTYVNEATGTYNYDCSGFVGYALRRLSLPAWNDVPRGSRSRPLAEDFAVRCRIGPRWRAYITIGA